MNSQQAMNLYDEYKKKKEKLSAKYPGVQKWDAIKSALSNFHKYDEHVQFLILHDALEHEYNLIKARNYRAKNRQESKVEKVNKAVDSALTNNKTNITKVPLQIDIPSNLVTPSNTEPNTPMSASYDL